MKTYVEMIKYILHRTEDQFEGKLADTCKNMTCPEGTQCYIEVLPGENILSIQFLNLI